MGRAGRARRSGRSRRSSDRPLDAAKRKTLKKLAAAGLLALAGGSGLSSCGRRSAVPLRRERRVIVLGLDGLDPRYLARLMSQGKLPNMSRLRELGGFRPLATTAPPQSPVAWATFITGLDPGGHGIYDFIQRDPETYLPYFSLASSKPAGRALTIGKWRFPLSRGKIELLRAGRAFWELLNERGLPASIYQVPSNYPPRDTGAKQLAGLGAPDLRGSYGEFSYYTEAPFAGEREVSGGRVYRVSTSRGRGKARLLGPENTLREGEPDCQIDFEIWLDRGHRVAEIGLQGRQILLREREWSDWIPLRFQMLPGLKHVSGICRFYLKEVSPHLKLYVTPVNADPLDPDLPVSAPAGFARELAQRFGRFYTQGFPHDVKALRQGVLDDDEYLQQSDLAQGEARRMYESALGEFRRGLLFHYFATSDRTQHVFWRTMDPRHPAYEAKAARRHGGAIEECYRASDELVGLALESAGADTTLIVLSDHGFLPYYRSFNLNAWLAEKGYLAGLGAWGPGADIFSNANWQETVAYGLGFNAIYLNLRGREARGCVLPEDRHKLARGLAADLRRMRDPETGERVIENVHLAEDVYSAFEAARAPDLVVGYAAGYRCSEASVLGEAGGPLLEDNADKWSGDHCMDSSLVPGVLLANKPIRAESPALPDVTASVLAEFGVRVPAELAGRPVW